MARSKSVDPPSRIHSGSPPHLSAPATDKARPRRNYSSIDRVLQDVPREYIRQVLVELAPRLIAGINCTTIFKLATETIQPSPTSLATDVDHLPKSQTCSFDPSRSRTESPLPPDCFLAFTFPPSSSRPSRLLVPSHSLVYAVASPLIPLVSACDTLAPTSPTAETTLDLPVIGPFPLPSYDAFVKLHSYLHDRSSARLLRHLLLSASTTSRPPSPPPSPTLDGTSQGLDRDKDQARQLDDIHNLRRTAVALEIPDETFWTTLARAHTVVTGR